MVVIKLKFEDDIRRLTIETSPSFEEFVGLVKKLYADSLPVNFVLKYLDDENDLVSITCGREVEEAFSFANGGILRVNIFAGPKPELAAKCEASPPPQEEKKEQSAQEPEKDDQDTSAPVVHPAICDHCNNTIVGTRFKCINCPDFDLCEDCEKIHPGVHDATHAFLKLRFPTRHPYLPPFMRGRYRRAVRGKSCQGRLGVQPTCARPQWRRPVCRPLNDQPEDKLMSRFVEDVTVEDGSVLPLNTKFVKIWKLRNIGTKVWPAGTRLVFVAGDVLGLVDEVVLANPVKPDEEINLAVEMNTPQQIGRYVSNWRLCSPAGVPFGHRVWADILVAQPRKAPAPEEVAPPAAILKPTVEEKKEETTEEKKEETTEEKKEDVLQAVEAPVESKVVPEDSMASLLQQLKQMGFDDQAANMLALQETGGDVLVAVHKLLGV